jgi:hypothetical protein
MLTPEDQMPERVLEELKPLLDQLHVALERGVAEADRWFLDGDHEADPYFRAMMIRYHVREFLQAWQAELRMVDEEVEVRRPSNVGLHISWRDRYAVRVRMGDDRAVPVPTSGAAVDFFNQPLLGMDLPMLHLFVLWSSTSVGVQMQVACPRSAQQSKKETLQLAWRETVRHPVETPVMETFVAPMDQSEEQDVPWIAEDVDDEGQTGEESPL